MSYFVTDYNTVCSEGELRAVLEDSIMQKGRPVTAGSKMLENFISPIDATVVTRLLSAGIKILGKTKMNEFGLERIDPDRPDNLSSAVAAVKDGAADVALCNDFSGTVRRQAPEHGLYYIHPSYGTVSRYGLIPAVSSMDQIGVLCRKPEDGFFVLSVISGNDPRDGAMYPREKYEYKPDKTDIKLGLPENVLQLTGGTERAAVSEFAGLFNAVSFELKYFSVFSQVMYILSCAEISNNITRYDGIKFGYRAQNYHGLDDLYRKSRTEAFGPEVKLAAIMGSMVLSQEQYARYYDKAMRLRNLIKSSFEAGEFDAVILPAWPEAGPYEQSALYALATLGGLPSVSIPYHGGAVELVSRTGENTLYSALKAVLS